MFQSKKIFLGMDIGSKTTKIAQLSFVGGKATLEKCALAETGYAEEGFASQLKSFLSEQKVKGSAVAVCFDDPSLLIRKLELPKMPDPDFLEALRWNLREHVDNDPTEYVVMHSVISEDNSGGEASMLKIVAYAVKRQAVEDFKSKVEQLGLSVQMIEPEAVSLAATLDRCEGQDTNRYIAGVDIGHSHTLFYVVGQGVFVFSRPIKGLDLSAYGKEPEEFPQKLAIEIQKSIDTFQVTFEMHGIEALYLSGGGSLIEGLGPYLESTMGLKVQTIDPFKSLTRGDESGDLPPALFAKAISLAYAQL